MTGPLAAQLPVLGPIARGVGEALRRFPWVLVSAGIAATAAILLIDEIGNATTLGGLLAASSLGIPLFIALALTAERPADARWMRLALPLVGVAVLLAFYAGWDGWSESVRAARYVQLSAAFHLLAAFLPFLFRPATRGFWEYNRRLLERFLTAAIYTAVLFGGLALALVALDQLFGVDVPDTGYVRLWIVMAFIFHPWFFLAGLPRDLAGLDRELDYPPPLRGFAQYVLVPIVAVYLTILTVYLGKVLVTWEWPSGWIGWLVSGVAVVGIFALLLVHPIAGQAGSRWVGVYARGFWIGVLPAIVMLWLAIWQRVAQYGVTERRYFLIVLSVWLAAVAGYGLLTRTRSIRFIPATLCLGALLTFIGPWGAYRVSERSQVQRLADILVRHGILAEGRLQPPAGDVPREDRREISAILHYLVDTHGVAAIAGWFDDSLRGLAEGDGGRGVERRVRGIVEKIGVAYADRRGATGTWGFTYQADARGPGIGLAASDTLLLVGDRMVGAHGPGLRARTGRGGRAIEVFRDGVLLGSLPLDTLAVALRDTAPARPADRRVPAERLRIEREVPGLRLVLQLQLLQGRWQDDSVTITGQTGVLLVRRR